MVDSFHIKVESGKVDGQRLCITGRSAGGYTTLASLAFRDTFKAGASLYGVSCHKYVPDICIFLFLLSNLPYVSLGWGLDSVESGDAQI
jgi:hypothetical protein